MMLLKNIAFCLIIGFGMGFLATQLGFARNVGFSPYIVTIPTAFVPFITGTLKIKKK